MVLFGAVLPVGIVIMGTVAEGFVSGNLGRKETSSEHNDKHVKRLIIKETWEDISTLKEQYINRKFNDIQDNSLQTKDKLENHHTSSHLNDDLSTEQTDDEPNPEENVEIQRTKDIPEKNHTFKQLDNDQNSEQADDKPNPEENVDIQNIEQREDYQNDLNDENELDFGQYIDGLILKQFDDDLDYTQHYNDSKSKKHGYDTKNSKRNEDGLKYKRSKNDKLSNKRYKDDLKYKDQHDNDSNSKEHDNIDINSKKFNNEPNSKKANDDSNSKKHGNGSNSKQKYNDSNTKKHTDDKDNSKQLDDDDDLNSTKNATVQNSKQHDDADPNSKKRVDDPDFELDGYQPNSEQQDDDASGDGTHDHHKVYELTTEEIKHPRYRVRYDGHCGLDYPLPNGLHGQCDSRGDNPCCSPSGWCGNTDEYCKNGGVDYRGNCGPHLGLWLCADGTCIFIENVCNGKEDCIDGSDEPSTCPVHCSVDEFSCNSESEERKCISRIKLCDGISDCDHGEDELDCNYDD